MTPCLRRHCPLRRSRVAQCVRLLLCLLSASWLSLSGARAQDAGTGTWEIVHRESQSGFLWAVAAGRPGVVAVGSAGRIVVSIDGRTWRNVASPVTDWLVDVAYDEQRNRYIAVGDRGTLLTSSDLSSWTRVPQTATDQRLNAIRVVFSPSGVRYLAVGERGTIIVSSDGLAWRAVQSGTTAWLRGIAGQGGFGWIVVGQGGVILASDNCVDWRPVASPTTQDLEAAVFVSGFSATAKSAPVSYGWADYAAIGAGGTEVRLNYSYTYTYGSGQPPRTFTPSARLATGESRLPSTIRFRGFTMVGEGKLLAFGEDGSAYSGPPYNSMWARTELGTRANIVAGISSASGAFLVGEDSTILLQPSASASRLRNLSTRGYVGPGLQHLTAGVVVRGTMSKQLLVRAIGPALAQFGVAAPLPAPVLTIFSSANTIPPTRVTGIPADQRAEVRAAMISSGAFFLQEDARDAATVVRLPPGGYTFRVESGDGAAGEALVEVYDLEPASPQASTLVNVSTRGTVSASRPLIAGFVVDGPNTTGYRRLFARAVGPGLQQFGVTSTVADPSITLHAGSPVPYTAGYNDNWQQQSNDPYGSDPIAVVRAVEAGVGAFALPEASKDAALVIHLPPRAYTAVVGTTGTTPAEALVEIYDVPF